MSQQFKHFVITRFNIKVEEWKSKTTGEDRRTDEWMENRIALFRKTCFPSITNQSVTNFFWLIYLDIDTKDEYRLQLEEMIKPYDRFHLRYVDGFVGFQKSLSKDVNYLLGDAKFIISTRIDNDDAFHQDYLKRVQEQFQCQDLIAIDFLNGFQWDIVSNKFYTVQYDSNPFISLIEKVKNKEDILTVFHREHRHYLEKGDFQIKEIETERLWIQIVHGKNVYNRITGIETNSTGLLLKFNIE